MHIKKIIAGNWKMHKTIAEAKDFIENVLPHLSEKVSAYLSIPYTAIASASNQTRGTSLVIGAQNMYYEDKGAYTGEISIHMLKEAGADFVLIGHSERRTYFGCTDEIVNLCLKKALLENVQPIVCVGETLEERERGETQKVLEAQLNIGLQGLSKDGFEHLILAYEPIWAIGTGKTATPDIAQKAHEICKNYIKTHWKLKHTPPILYGGSVKPSNIKSLLLEPGIDGVLVGGASLESNQFIDMIKITEALES